MIFISTLHNPYQNLALEHALFQNTQAPSLFLYVNTPCVVIGRAQNPWIEANLAYMQQRQIPLLRRQSGGGTVVHDLGNLNFSFMSPTAHYDKQQHLRIVLKALHDLGIPATVNERHDLMLQGKKISGSAFRETRDHCFHHGTLLIESDLPALREALAAPPLKIKTNAVPSVRSAVMNLCDFKADLSMQQMQSQLITAFSLHHQFTIAPTLLDETALDSPLAQTALSLYQSQEWLYHKTLPFEEQREVNGQIVTLYVEQGVIMRCVPLLSECEAWIGTEFAVLAIFPSPFAEEGRVEGG